MVNPKERWPLIQAGNVPAEYADQLEIATSEPRLFWYKCGVLCAICPKIYAKNKGKRLDRQLEISYIYEKYDL
jgi:hypothetical protein